jgi:hypothetical protein
MTGVVVLAGRGYDGINSHTVSGTVGVHSKNTAPGEELATDEALWLGLAAGTIEDAAEGEADMLAETLAETEFEGDATIGDGVADSGGGARDGHAAADAVTVIVTVANAVTVAVTVEVTVAEAVTVAVTVADAVTVTVTVTVGPAECVTEGVGDVQSISQPLVPTVSMGAVFPVKTRRCPSSLSPTAGSAASNR